MYDEDKDKRGHASGEGAALTKKNEGVCVWVWVCGEGGLRAKKPTSVLSALGHGAPVSSETREHAQGAPPPPLSSRSVFFFI
jgi:hypothetical protein